ncbi:unnamed protein product [Camellia sinensis]
MAATMATASTAVVGLGTSSLSLSSRVSSPKTTSLNSAFLKSPVRVRNPLVQAHASGGKFTCFERDWLRTDLNVIGFGLIGWLAPSSVPAINGNSLTGLFFSSIGTELSHFPTGPALDSPFCVVDGLLAFRAVLVPYFWANWHQGEDRGVLLRWQHGLSLSVIYITKKKKKKGEEEKGRGGGGGGGGRGGGHKNRFEEEGRLGCDGGGSSSGGRSCDDGGAGL